MKSLSWVITVASVLMAGMLALAATPGFAESKIVGVTAMKNGGSMALSDDGTVWLWGLLEAANGSGPDPALMQGVDRVAALSSDGFPVVLKDDGTVWLENVPAKEHVKIKGFSDIVAISGSSYGLLGIRKDGTVWFCASPGVSDETTPVQGLSGVIAVSAGNGHYLALKKDGTVWAWGFNNNGQLGDGTDAARLTVPAMVEGLAGVKAIAAGDEFSMALKDDGTVWTWGRNIEGQLGDGKPMEVEMNSPVPVQVTGLTNVVAISAGQWSAFALRDDGTVRAWGDNRYKGMLGDGTTTSRNSPVQVKGLSDIVSISSGYYHSLALDRSGVIWAWGADDNGQLGDGRSGTNLYRATADKVPFTEAIAGTATGPERKASPRPTMEVNTPASASDSDQIGYIATVNDTIYAFSANGLIAMDKNAIPKWNISISGRWAYGNTYEIPIWPECGYTVKPVPVFSVDSGHIYLYALARPFDGTYDPMQNLPLQPQARMDVEKELIAVAPDGKVEWIRNFTDDVIVEDRSHVEAHNGRIYLYHDYNETVFDSSGNALFTIENISDPVSVDEDGSIYAVPAVRATIPWYHVDLDYDNRDFDYRDPSNVVEKYSPDGKMSWRKELPENVSRPYYTPSVQSEVNGIPLYRGGVLYVPLDKGVMAMNTNGDILWTKTFDIAYRFFYLRPMDTNGNLYLFHHFDRRDPGYGNALDTIVAISPDGSEVARANKASIFLTCSPDGVLYEPVAADGVGAYGIQAYDIIQGRYLWNITLPIGDMHTVVLDESNAPGLISDVLQLPEVIPAGDLTYINYRKATWDKPVVYGQSKYSYYSALYAVARNGTLVWQKPMDSFVMAAAANNTTVYYGTKDGGISASTIGMAAGAVVGIGAVLLFLKFFVLGSVARARARLDKNDNRRAILKFIAERPGSTLYDIRKGLGLNMGTVRYHLAILGMGHRLATYNDGKFVRYFTNSNTYGPEDRMIISLLRRESMGRVLTVIASGYGLTNVEICREIGLPESAVSRYLAELVKKGVVSRDAERSIGAIYSLKPEHRLRVMGAIRLIEESPGIASMAGPSDRVGAYEA